MHGVAHIRISTSPVKVDADFYGVFVHGRMSPIKFDTWISAFRHFNVERDAPKTALKTEASHGFY